MKGDLFIQAQGLKRALTSYDKLVDSDDGQVLYLMWKKDPNREYVQVLLTFFFVLFHPCLNIWGIVMLFS